MSTKGRGSRESVRQGDGSTLPRLRLRDALSRTVMGTWMPDEDGNEHTYAVFVDFFADEEDARLYRDGVQVAVADLPARFPVPGGRLEVATSLYGLKRAHLVRDDGTEEPLYPARNSAEWWRARFGRRFPRADRLIARLAVVVLLVALALAVPQLLELVTGWDALQARGIGQFESPVRLPAWANTGLGVAAFLAAMERALTLRSHWLVDAETYWLDD